MEEKKLKSQLQQVQDELAETKSEKERVERVCSFVATN